MMKILITGVQGFVGGAIYNHLIKNPSFNIIANGRRKSNHYDTYINWDLTEKHERIDCDVCIHVAGLADDKASKQKLFSCNVFATQNLIETIPSCHTLIYISSSSVYDFSDESIKDEFTSGPFHKLSLYGQSKLQAEEYIKNCNIPNKWILRPRAIYGKGDRILLPRILQLMKYNFFLVPGKLSQCASLTNISNLVSIVEQILSNLHQGLQVYNVTDLQNYNLNEIFHDISHHYNKKSTTLRIPKSFIKVLLQLSQLAGFRTNINHQSMQYIWLDSRIDISRLSADFDLEDFKEFNVNSLDDYKETRSNHKYN